MPSQFPSKGRSTSLTPLFSLFIAERNTIWHETPFWLVWVLCLLVSPTSLCTPHFTLYVGNRTHLKTKVVPTSAAGKQKILV